MRQQVIMPLAGRPHRQHTGTIVKQHHTRMILLLATIMMVLQPLPVAQADILVYQILNDQIIEEFRDLPATFGGEIPDSGLKVLADKADPADGCTEMRAAPNGTTKFAVVIARYNCSFEVKVRNAQQAGYALVIVHNVGSNDLEHMSANHPQDLLIPSVFVGESSGRSIIEAYLYDRDYALVITDDIPFNISNNLIIPFAIVVGLCFIIMVLLMIIRCIRERRRMLRHRLPVRVLKKIGIVKFAKGMSYETCAICLDDFVENERLRVLPCRHAYHAICIDPWLTKNKRVCPICKRRVIVRGERRLRRYSSDSSSSNVDESTPLLNNGNSAENNGQPAAPVVSAPPAQSSSSSPAPAEGGPVASGPPPTPSAGDGMQDSIRQEQQQLQGIADSLNSHLVDLLPSDDDDELLDDRNVPSARWLLGAPGSQQQQPPQQQQQQQPAQPEPTHSPAGEGMFVMFRFNFFQRFFSRTPATTEANSGTESDQRPPALPPPAPDTAASNVPIGTGNNILNWHQSGWFHGSEDTTDDELLDAMRRDRTKQRQFRSAPDMPSTSAGARLGVAALPNVNFNPGAPAGPDGNSSRGPRTSRQNRWRRNRPDGNSDDSHIV